MILRKPYAFLIKHFKIIHIIMFIAFGYFVFALRKIYVFFSSYIGESSHIYREDMASFYVPWILFLLAIILLASAIGILLLMRKKEKPVLFYRIMIGYSIFLIVVLAYFVAFFNSLDNTVYEPLRVVINRDIILFAYIINFFFVAFSFIRGFGFDIKKFSFDKDKKELNLEESDSEEYELNVGIEKDDVKSFLNRHKREFKYYLKENIVFFSIVGAITIISVSAYAYYSIFVMNKIYHEKENVSIGNLTYRVNNSMINNIDKYGQEISSTDDYLIINMNIINDSVAGYLDTQTFRINVDEKYYYPSISLCDLFSDLGSCYKNQELKSREDVNYIFVYKIKKEHQDIYLEILKSKGDEYQYSKIKLDYVLQNIKDINSSNMEFEINSDKFTINKYNLVNKTSYQYQECHEDKCNTFQKMVLPNTGDWVLELEISNLDKISDDLLNNAIGIKYNDIIYSGKKIKFITKYDNKVYYSVPAFLAGVNEYTLLVTNRETRYNIILKGA